MITVATGDDKIRVYLCFENQRFSEFFPLADPYHFLLIVLGAPLYILI